MWVDWIENPFTAGTGNGRICSVFASMSVRMRVLVSVSVSGG